MARTAPGSIPARPSTPRPASSAAAAGAVRAAPRRTGPVIGALPSGDEHGAPCGSEGATNGRHRRSARSAPLARDQPPRAGDARHGRDRPVLRRCPEHAPRRNHHGGPDAPLLLRDEPGQHGGLLRGRGRRDVRQGGRRPHRSRHPTRPHLLRRARRTRAGAVAQAAPRGGFGGHHGRRPRLHPLGVLHRSERHRARGVVVGRGRHGPAVGLQRSALFGDPDPVPAVVELQAGGITDVPRTRLT